MGVAKSPAEMLKMLTQERVRELFNYREDGALLWRVRTSNRATEGSVAGCAGTQGYLRVRVDTREYPAHRLVWLWHHRYLPEDGIDHLDQCRANNRIENLREAGKVCNARNTGNPQDNKSGVKGVCWNARDKRWVAQIGVGGETFHLGLHVDFLEAVCHRLAAEQALDWAGCDSDSPALKHVKKYIPHNREQEIE